MLKGYHILQLCQDSGDLQHFTFRLSVVQSSLTSEIHLTAQTALRLLQPWSFDHSQSFIFSLPVLVIAPLVFRGTRHSFALKTGLCTLQEVLKYLTQVATQHKGRVILSKRGAFLSASKTDVLSTVSDSQITSDISALRALYERGQLALEGVDNPWPTPLLGECDHLSESLLDEVDNPDPNDLKATVLPVSTSASTAPPDAPELLPEASRDALWNDLKPHSQGARTSEEHFRLFNEVVTPILESVREKNVAETKASLALAGRFNNEWLRFEMKHTKDPQAAVHRMVTTYRQGNFGPNNATHGPSPEVVDQFLLGKIPREHLDLFTSMITQGADPVFLGPKAGYKARPYPSTEEVDTLALWDFHALVTAKRALTFDLSQDPQIELWLVEAGVHLGPIIAAPKKSAHGQDLVDDWGDLVLRLCNDSTNGNHPLAANTGLRSWQHSFQKTTTSAQVAHHQIKEEKKHPNCEIRAIRDDIAKAFNLIAILLRRIGLFASLCSNFALINLNLPFGPISSPGLFDVFGDIMVKALIFTDRPSDQDLPPELITVDTPQESEEKQQNSPGWVNPIGESHPEVARFVDDLFSLVAQYGNRTNDHLERLRGLLTTTLGDHALNLKKQGVEGTAEPYKHAFGAVLDCCGRKLKACWSKIVKVSNLMLPFVNREVDTLDHGTVEQIRGVAGHATTHAPGMARLLLPRLDAWLSSVALAGPP